MSIYTVDMGHTLSGSDTGASGNGLREEILTREIGNIVAQLLRKEGHTVHIVQLDSASSLTSSLNYRVDKIVNINPDQSVSIHINSASDSSATGVEVWGDNLCKDACDRICSNISNAFNIPNRGFKNGCESLALVGLYGSSSIPAMLVECFFICNKSDCDKYNAQKYAECIVSGLLNKQVTSNEYKVKGTGFSVTGDIKVDIPLRLSATAEPISEAMYKFWYCDRTTNTWTVLQDYKLNGNIINWTPNKTGNHTLVCHIKHKNSSKDYDEAMSKDINVKQNPSVKCTGFSLLGEKEVGEKLSLSATSEPLDSSMYKFWVCDRRDNSWIVIQDYKMQGNVAFFTPSKEGNYTFVVHTKHKDSSREYDDVKAIDLVIDSKKTECSHVEEIKRLETIKKEIDLIINSLK